MASALAGTPPRQTLCCRGKLLDLRQPQVMGILNLTPDSFRDGGRYLDPGAAEAHAAYLLDQGATVLDLGAASSRPGAETVPAVQEWARLAPALTRIRDRWPELLISIDTWRADVAAQALAAGADIINDISAGRWEPALMAHVAEARAGYILMHMQGTPATMQQAPHYQDVVAEVWDFFVERVNALQAAGVYDLVLDCGFGFGKSLMHNYQLLAAQAQFALLGPPLLVGISGKRLVRALLPGQTLEALEPAYTALHLQALLSGARLLRVHEPGPALQAVKLWQALTAPDALAEPA